MIKSTSLPTGIIEETTIQTFDKDIEAGDIMLMCSDGILDSNIEYKNKEFNLSKYVSDNNISKVLFLYDGGSSIFDQYNYDFEGRVK